MPDPILTLEIMRLLTLAELEKLYIRHVLQQTGGKVSGPGGAAEILGKPASTLRSRMARHGILAAEFRD